MKSEEILRYEVASFWLVGFIPTEWGARYIAWKVKRKLRRYKDLIESAKILESDMTDEQKFLAFRELDKKLK